jgi:hypothetical protein
MNRRTFLAGVSAVTLAGGAGCSGNDESRGVQSGLDSENVRRNAEEIPYEALIRNGRQYVGDAIHVPQGKIVRARGNKGSEFQLRVCVTRHGISWDDEVFVGWVGEAFPEGEIIELWGQYNGRLRSEGASGTEKPIPAITAADIDRLDVEKPLVDVV